MTVAARADLLQLAVGGVGAAERRVQRVPRVLYLETNEDGTVGGSHQVLFDMARLLDRRRYVPVALFYQENAYVDRLRDARVETHLMVEARASERAAMRSGRLHRQMVTFVQAIVRRVRFLREHGIALLHVNGTPQAGHDDWLPAARLLGLPAVATCAINVRLGDESRLQRAFMRGFTRVLPVSEHVAQQVHAMGYRPNRVRTIYPGIDVAGFRARARRPAHELRAELTVEAGDTLLLLVGNLRAWKGQRIAIQAVAALEPAERSRVVLAFAGVASAADARYERALRAEVDAAGLRDRVRFLGRREDVPDLVVAADIVLHASTWPEPFGLVVIEAMALGRPVIASSLGGPSETLDERSGLRFSPAEPATLTAQLASLLLHPERRAAMGAAGRRRAELFDIRYTVDATMQVYDELLGRHG